MSSAAIQYDQAVRQQYVREQLLRTVSVKMEMQNREAWRLCGKRESSFQCGPLLWLTRYTATEDQHWLAKGTPPVAPFPQKPYFEVVMQYMLTESDLFIWKSREMMTSWLACGYISWMTQFLPSVQWLIQTEKIDKAKELIGYCKVLYRRQPQWMRDRNLMVRDNETEIVRANGSSITAIPKGENQVRLFHPYGYLMDEAAFLPDAEQCFNAARPVVKQVIAVSTDDLGWFHNCCAL